MIEIQSRYSNLYLDHNISIFIEFTVRLMLLNLLRYSIVDVFIVDNLDCLFYFELCSLDLEEHFGIHYNITPVIPARHE